MEFRPVLERLIARQDLDQATMRAVMDAVMDGQLTQAQIGALLAALRTKGECVAEIAGAAQSMRQHATYVDAGAPPIVDIVGTGGDGANTFNISTTAALLAAAAGVKIAKHGNRSISSACGSADVLTALGVNVQASPEQVAACIRTVGIGFLFAPLLHGAMKHAIGARRELGVRTIFNLLGPLTNPAHATAHVIGVFAPQYTPIFGAVLRDLGSTAALIVHSHDGLDEISGAALTQVTELRGGEVRTYDFDPRPYLGAFCDPAALKGGAPAHNATLVQEILAGTPGPRADVALLNAAAALHIVGQAPDFGAAWEQVRAAWRAGHGAAKLAALVAASNAPG